MFSIRSETDVDFDAVGKLIVAAFTDCEFGHSGEAELVGQLRDDCDDLLSLVAVDRGAVVGHILFSPVSVLVAGRMVHGMGLAPMAVMPDRQKVGVGTAMVETGLSQLRAAGCPFVVVLGHPDYYPRFGFLPAAKHGLSHGFGGIPQDVFFVKLFDPSVFHATEAGAVVFRSEFGPQHGGKE